jgi:hypothetical protein
MPQRNAALCQNRCYSTQPLTLNSEICTLLKFCINCCAVVFGLMLSSCATVSGPTYTYNEVVVLNRSRAPLQDVRISATESGRVFSCGNIAPRGICSNKFQPQPYQGSPIQIAWVIGNGRRHSETIELELPKSFVAELPMRGVLVIDDQGAFKAYLQQEPPGPHL